MNHDSGIDDPAIEHYAAGRTSMDLSDDESDHDEPAADDGPALRAMMMTMNPPVAGSAATRGMLPDNLDDYQLPGTSHRVTRSMNVPMTSFSPASSGVQGAKRSLAMRTQGHGLKETLPSTPFGDYAPLENVSTPKVQPVDSQPTPSFPPTRQVAPKPARIPSRSFENPKARLLPPFHPPVPTSCLVPLRGRPLVMVCSDFAKACVHMGIQMECFDDPVSANLRTCEYARLQLAVWLSSDNQNLVVELHPIKGDDLVIRRYCSYLLGAAQGNLDLESCPKTFPDINVDRQRKIDEALAKIINGRRTAGKVDKLAPFRLIQRLLKGRPDEFQRGLELLLHHLDLSKVGIANAVATSQVVLHGTSPTDQGTDLCQDISSTLKKAFEPGTTLFDDQDEEMSDDGYDSDFEEVGFGAPTAMADFRSETFCNVLHVMVRAVEVGTNAQALEVAGVSPTALSPDFVTRATEILGDLVDDATTRPAEAALGLKGLRHLAAVSPKTMEYLLRGSKIGSLQTAHQHGSKHNAVLGEQAYLLFGVVAGGM